MYIFSWWQWVLVVVLFYVGCLVGANSPTTFKRSKAGLQKIADAALAKARRQ